MEWLILFLIGLSAGTLGAVAGLGGGIIVVPALIYFGNYTNLLQDISPQVAVGTSLLIMIFTGLSSTLSYLRHKVVDYKSGLIFFIGSGPGGIVGAWVNQSLNIKTFNIYFGLFIIFISILLMVKGKLKPISNSKPKQIVRIFTDRNGHKSEYGFNLITGISISFVVGFLSGFFGIGGGALMVPAMILIFLFPPHVAVATSMFMIFLSAITSSATHITLGNIHWLYALILIPVAWIGAKIGAYINSKLRSDTLVKLLRVVLIIIGLRLIYQGFVG